MKIPKILIFLSASFIILAFASVSHAQEEKTTEWKDKNIRILHLIAGLIMLVLGVLVLLGLV